MTHIVELVLKTYVELVDYFDSIKIQNHEQLDTLILSLMPNRFPDRNIINKPIRFG